MADFYFEFDFELPSFSLGLDLDGDSEPQPVPRAEPLSQQAKSPSTPVNLRPIEGGDDDDDGFESRVRVCDRPQTLKRLRRGLTPGLVSKPERVGSEDGRCNVDDDIEEFSSGEDWPRGNLPPDSVCGSSKVSLHGHKVVTSESGSHWKSRKAKDVPNSSASANVEAKVSNVKFPKLTESPLRRFQLIDSDSDFDDLSVIEDTSKVSYVNLTPKSKQSNSGLATEKTSGGNYQSEDLWKDFCSEKSFHIPTPAFDEVCNEYFTDVQNKSQTESIRHKDPVNERKSDGTPPAHCYFFHKDLRIRKLVRERLQYFFPLEAANNLEHKLQNASVIDYMGQFGHEETSRQIDRRPIGETSSTRKRKNVKRSQVDVSQDSNSWVDPKICVGLPRNAANQRVQADTKSTGRWFTDSSGRKVYLNKSGQELTGQIAYRHYRKESGVGSRKSKKKSAAKKKTSAKKAGSKKR